MDFQIRDIVESDMDSLASVYADAYKAEKTNEHWTKESALNTVIYWYKRSPADLKILAHDGNKILGAFLADIKPWWDGPRLIDGEFFVRTDCQAHGIGKALLKTMLNRAKNTYQATCFETMTFAPDTEYPLKWYKKIGFDVVDNLVVIKGPMDTVLKKLSD